MEHSQPYSDTDPRAMEVWIGLIRRQTLGEKLSNVLLMADGGHAQLQANLRRKYPQATEREIFQHVAVLNIGTKLTFPIMNEIPRSSPSEGFARLLAAIDRVEIPYFVGGSVASSTYGLERFTRDVDLVVEVLLDRVEELTEQLLKEEFYADAATMSDAIQRHRAFNVIYQPCIFKFDLFPLQADVYSRSQFARRKFAQTRVLGAPVECAMASPEDVILSKLRWYRLGNEKSEQQWHDMWGVVKVRGPQLDMAYLHEWAPKLNVADLLERLLAEFE